MDWSGKLSMWSRKCYAGVDFPSKEAARGMNTNIILEWKYIQFITTVDISLTSKPLALYLLIFFRGHMEICLHVMSLLYIDMAELVEILTYSTESISWLLMTWRRKEPCDQQPWHLLCWTTLIRSPHVRSMKSNQKYNIHTSSPCLTR